MAQLTGVSIGAVQKRRTGLRRTAAKESKHAHCPRCDGAQLDERAYAYLLGLYLRRRFAGSDHWYEYPRYFFNNKSLDILLLCGQTLDRLGVEWRYSRWDSISVAKKDAAARLDGFVGPKY